MDPFTIALVFFVLKAVGLGYGIITLEGKKSFLEAVDATEFLQALDTETDVLQREINTKLHTLTRLHSALALLAAAVSGTHNPNRDLTEPAEFKVPAYDKKEISDDRQSGWIPEAVKDIETVEAANDTTLGIKFPTEVIQKVRIGSVDRPVLQPFLEKFRALGLSPKFDPVVCLKTCYDTAAQIETHSKTMHCVVKALTLLRSVWGPDVKHNLAEASSWLTETPHPLTTTEDWLKQKLQWASLLDPLTALYNSSDDQRKLAISKITKMLQANSTTFYYIYEYCFVDDGQTRRLETVITKDFKANVPHPQQEAWNDLLSATYGAIAWQIFQQARLAMDAACTALG